jgi:hypothetical protein
MLLNEDSEKYKPLPKLSFVIKATKEKSLKQNQIFNIATTKKNSSIVIDVLTCFMISASLHPRPPSSPPLFCPLSIRQF